MATKFDTVTGEAHTPGASTDPGDAVSLSACLECRQRHLKCDGTRPCARCVRSQSDCVFVPSRRGQRRELRHRLDSRSARGGKTESRPAEKRTYLDAGFPALVGYDDDDVAPIISSNNPIFRSSVMPIVSGGDLQALTAWNKPPSRPPPPPPSPHIVPRSNSCAAVPSLERCLASYYYNFHASHPLALPQSSLRPLMAEEALRPLLAVMHWVGSIYIAPAAQKQLLERARLAVDEAADDGGDSSSSSGSGGGVANGFTVQAMTVMLVALDGAGHREQAIELLVRTKRLLLSLGMNERRFSVAEGRGSRVMEESWRRTWWELYVLDGMFAGAHRATAFTLFEAPTDVELPCEEDQYMSGRVPDPPLSMDALQDGDLAEEEHEFSSFAYRILSAQNLGKVMRGFTAASLDEDLHLQMEILLTNWRQTVPAWKRDSLRRDGRPDEMMLQAHMINYMTSILLHQSHAQMDASPARMIDACAPPPHEETTAGDAGCCLAAEQRPNMHARHVMHSAKEICKMITHRTPMTWHTHFFICAIVLSAIVQLGGWAAAAAATAATAQLRREEEEQGGEMPGSLDEESLRQQIRLCIGALQQMSTVWGTATRALGQVREVARQIHVSKRQSRQMMEQLLVDFTEEDMMNILAGETPVLSEMERVA